MSVCILSMFRYVDMIANPEVADIFRNRAKVSHLPFPKSNKEPYGALKFSFSFLNISFLYNLTIKLPAV